MANKEPKAYGDRYEESPSTEIVVAGEEFLYEDYGQLDLVVAMTLKDMVVAIRMRQRNALSDQIATGNQLIAAKILLGHGKFEKWAYDELDLGSGRISELRQVAERFGGADPTIIEALLPTTAIMLASKAVPDDVIWEVVKRSKAAGRPLLVREVKDVKRQKMEESESFSPKPIPEEYEMAEGFHAVILEEGVWIRIREALRHRNLDRYVGSDDLDKFAVAVAAGLSEEVLVDREATWRIIEPTAVVFEKWLEEMPPSDDIADLASLLRVVEAKLWVARERDRLELPAINVLTHLRRLIEEIDGWVS